MSNFLYANDERAVYPASWYAQSADKDQPRPAARGKVTCDVCVIGAGYTGLSTAYHLALRGFDVVVLDAHRVGFGASGRNGGQVGSGWNHTQRQLEKSMGHDAAHRLWDMAEDAKALVRDLVANHIPDASYEDGVCHADFHTDDVAQSHRDAEHLATNYNYDQVECLHKAGLAQVIKSERYAGGVIDRGAGHLHPLRYAIGLARLAESVGVKIHETSPVHQVQDGTPNVVRTDRAQIHARYVVHATNGYHGSLNRSQASRVMPINNYLVATAPLETPSDVLAQRIAVADNRFVLNYYRLSHDNRLIFGGGESYGTKFPNDIFAKVRKPLAEIFPQLADVELTHAWGGTLGITPSRLPMFARVGTGQFTASGYSGHGVALSTFAGSVLAETIAGQEERF
ncbi:MAG: NAD(P)/FAD-dependent oxidoreductase, partial [Planktomarina sp.]